jgi:hypothetical protein
MDLKGLKLSWFPLKELTSCWWVWQFIIQQQNPHKCYPNIIT